jgi:predicted nucleotidyltransferase
MSKIKKTGKIYKFDNDGYLMCYQDKSNIQGKWNKVLNNIVNVYTNSYKDQIHSIYVRGSVATGEAFDNVSDIDLIVLFKIKLNPVIVYRFGEFNLSLNDDIKKEYPFVTKIDLAPHFIINHKKALNGVGDNYDSIRFHIKHHSACIYGENIQKQISRYKSSSKFITTKNSQLELDLNLIKSKYEYLDSFDIKKYMTWISKRIVRYGYDLVKDELNIYTRDLYHCYKLFSKFFPEKENEMKMILEKAIFPTSEINELDEILDFGYWLLIKLKLTSEK